MNRRGFLKSTLGFGAGLFAAQLAIPGSAKCKMISPATDLIARNYFDDVIKSKISQYKKENPTLKIGETHCHSTFSDGTSSVKEIINRASCLGLDFLVLTEHLIPEKYPLELTLASINERWRCVHEWNSTLFNPVQVYPAFEVSTTEGHLILVLDPFYLEKKTFQEIRMQFSRFNFEMGSMEEAAKMVRPFGGITIIPHPEKERGYPFGVSTSFVRDNLLGIVDAIEDISTGHGYEENYSDELGLASIGSSDDHFNLIIGTTVTAYDTNSNKDFIEAVRAKKTRAVKIDDSLREFIAAARLII